MNKQNYYPIIEYDSAIKKATRYGYMPQYNTFKSTILSNTKGMHSMDLFLNKF